MMVEDAMSQANPISECETQALQALAALQGMTVAQLITLRDEAERLITLRRETEKVELLREMEERAKAIGLTLEDIIKSSAPQHADDRKDDSRKARSDRGSSLKPKYRHWADPELTWTGRGRRPRWVVEHEKNGGALAELAIQDS